MTNTSDTTPTPGGSDGSGGSGTSGVRRVYARLVVSDGPRAIDFYRAALGAEEVERYTDPDGKIVHAMITVGGTPIAVKDEDDADPAPTTLGGSPVVIALDVEDADAVADALLSNGATVVYPVADQPYGQRGGRVADPFGHLWMISQDIEALTPEEIQERTTAMFT
ncbi:VOC family protein [Yinghuangia soli]|uniref:VOC family protein n=1 Tax=Yinghuangia soli TaxID=2908204 RepID=A0AA41Q8S9_9ACTN|nr:VOC family protein [Yinghuangia soli]MCF2533347.1 VOC family protein [Yinghuangia soli]